MIFTGYDVSLKILYQVRRNLEQAKALMDALIKVSSCMNCLIVFHYLLKLLKNTSVTIATDIWFTEGGDKAGSHGMPS